MLSCYQEAIEGVVGFSIDKSRIESLVASRSYEQWIKLAYEYSSMYNMGVAFAGPEVFSKKVKEKKQELLAQRIGELTLRQPQVDWLLKQRTNRRPVALVTACSRSTVGIYQSVLGCYLSELPTVTSCPKTETSWWDAVSSYVRADKLRRVVLVDDSASVRQTARRVGIHASSPK